MKYQAILDDQWDYLIIIDACRYDFFEKVYKEYFSGELEKRRSRGSSTAEWLANTFPDLYEIKYISSNPNINSFGVETFSREDWKANDHFSEIIDVWNFGWDEGLNTVPPKEVNQALKKKGSDTRTILHYSQPHGPYLTYEHHYENLGTRSKGNMNSYSNKLIGIVMDFVVNFGFRAEKFLGKVNSWRTRRLLGMKPRNPLEEVWRNCELEEIYRLYESNLRSVLEKIKEIMPELHGKVIITSDHGEAFGEKGVWEHPSETHIPVLVEVPWLVVDSN